jgi:hypothetical protein
MEPPSDSMGVQARASAEAPPDARRQQGFAAERRAAELALCRIMAARHPGTVWTPAGDEEPAPGAIYVRIGGLDTSVDGDTRDRS